MKWGIPKILDQGLPSFKPEQFLYSQMDGVKDNHGSCVRVKIVWYYKTELTVFDYTGLWVGFFCFNKDLSLEKIINQWEGEVAGYTNSILDFSGLVFQE